MVAFIRQIISKQFFAIATDIFLCTFRYNTEGILPREKYPPVNYFSRLTLKFTTNKFVPDYLIHTFAVLYVYMQ